MLKIFKRHTVHFDNKVAHLDFNNIFDYNDHKTNHQELDFCEADMLKINTINKIYRGTLKIYYHKSLNGIHNITAPCESITVAVKIVENIDAAADRNNEPEMVYYLRDIQGIVKQYAYHIDRSSKRCIMVYEWCNGGDLFTYVVSRIDTSGRVNIMLNDIKKIIKWLLVIVKKCHERGILYCDLKLENIMLANKNDLDSLRLIDFGGARYIQEEGKDIKYEKLCTSPSYTSPEVFHHYYQRIDIFPYLEAYDMCGINLFKNDVWAIGVITYTMVFGLFPFNTLKCFKPHMAERAFSIRGKERIPPMDGVTPDTVDFISNMLHINPNKRYTMDEALAHEWLI